MLSPQTSAPASLRLRVLVSIYRMAYLIHYHIHFGYGDFRIRAFPVVVVVNDYNQK